MKNTPDISNSSRKHKFILFVSGMSVKSGRAIENMRKICEQYFTDCYELEIIDISRSTEQAAAYQIVAIPTLIKVSPEPCRIIIGDLSETQRVLKLLDITE